MHPAQQADIPKVAWRTRPPGKRAAPKHRGLQRYRSSVSAKGRFKQGQTTAKWCALQAWRKGSSMTPENHLSPNPWKGTGTATQLQEYRKHLDDLTI